MNDSLRRICGPADLTPAERDLLLRELDFIAAVFARIESGAGFCEDRGFGWTAEMERAEGTDRIVEALRAWPVLRRLLPGIRHIRHEATPFFGFHAVQSDDLRVARLVLTNTRHFGGHFGESWGEHSVQVRFGPDAISVREESLATHTSGEPFHAAEETADYSEPGDGPFWTGLAKKLPPETRSRAAALARRFGRAVFPCDRCGRPSQTFSISGTVLTYDGPAAARATADVTPEVAGRLREAFAAHDMPAIRRLNPDWATGYCETCDANYCRSHLHFRRPGVSCRWCANRSVSPEDCR